VLLDLVLTVCCYKTTTHAASLGELLHLMIALGDGQFFELTIISQAF